jgi:hypothetical protein
MQGVLANLAAGKPEPRAQGMGGAGWAAAGAAQQQQAARKVGAAVPTPWRAGRLSWPPWLPAPRASSSEAGFRTRGCSTHPLRRPPPPPPPQPAPQQQQAQQQQAQLQQAQQQAAGAAAAQEAALSLAQLEGLEARQELTPAQQQLKAHLQKVAGQLSAARLAEEEAELRLQAVQQLPEVGAAGHGCALQGPAASWVVLPPPGQGSGGGRRPRRHPSLPPTGADSLRLA